MNTEDELRYFSGLSNVEEVQLRYSAAEGVILKELNKIYMSTTKQRIAINIKPGILEIEE